MGSRNLQKQYEYHRARRASRSRFIDAVKTTCGCVDCGTRVGNLHLDHREPKTFGLSHGAGYSFKKYVAELMKCEVRCATCHARRHRREEGLRGCMRCGCGMDERTKGCVTCHERHRRRRQRARRG